MSDQDRQSIESGSLEDAFRLAMRQLAGGVCAISVGEGADRSGLIATSVTSLSASPPTLLVCINRTGSCIPLIQRFKSFGVSVLSHRHKFLAEHFSGRHGAKGPERFANGDWRTGATGAPILDDALVALDCSVEEMIERHSHIIVIGRVEGITQVREEEALAYMRGAYSVLSLTQPGGH